MSYRLSEKWIKASIAGTIWAASEIVLGSFLHNLKIPFSGNVLTAIGLIILISISYKWTEKGIFWRAGIICALLKTMSPSAVIFGPMIAIFIESVLLEISVRLMPWKIAGFLVGSMLAMSWNLLQKILNYIIFYGTNIVDIYTNIIKLAQDQLNIRSNITWAPVIIMLVIYALFGVFSGFTGIHVGRLLVKDDIPEIRPGKKRTVKNVVPVRGSDFKYSIIWLISDIALIIVAFILLNEASWIIWSSVVIFVIIIWSMRYKRALKQISKPKFWIFFVIITALTAFFFTSGESGKDILKQGLLIGLQMNFRAAIIIAGFSVLGTELYNPLIRKFFLKTSFKDLPLAMELSTGSLPTFIAYIPDLKSLIRNPVAVFHGVISEAENRLDEIKNVFLNPGNIYLVSGEIGEGKTTFLKIIAGYLTGKNIKVGGILSERVMKDGKTTGYDILNLNDGKRESFLRMNGDPGSETAGRFKINQQGLFLGREALRSCYTDNFKIVIIDEVGFLELNGKGWAEELPGLLSRNDRQILIAVRDRFIGEIQQKWKLDTASVIEVSQHDPYYTGLGLTEKLS